MACVECSHATRAQVLEQAQERHAAALTSKQRAAEPIEERRAARHAREAALDAERARAWRAARLAAVVRSLSALSGGLAAARRLEEARVRMQEQEAAVLVIQKCWRVRGRWRLSADVSQ